MLEWAACKKILIIRADNLGDLLMSSPAIRAIKQSFHAHITVLTSSMATGIASYLPDIDEVITYNVPWVKTNEAVPADHFFGIVKEIKERNFDGAIIFSVYSQNPLPAAMLAFLAGIPLRFAYCRENPYELLTHWYPDPEPYSIIKHQVRRDLELVSKIGAFTTDEKIRITAKEDAVFTTEQKLNELMVDLNKPWLILHAGVSETKREYPFERWVETAKQIINELGYQVLFTGGKSEKSLTDNLRNAVGNNSFSLGGLLSLDEFIALINKAPIVISVNTGTIHLAAATNTPVVVLYALTNPQHSPWQVAGKVLPFDVPKNQQSKNEVIKFVNETYFNKSNKNISPDEILIAVKNILNGNKEVIPEML
ncbi:MAG: glycosyl transferase family 9 [Sphingobacteriales bacterium]|nr:glycosyl transferase family 9 [Sphingobacteriales bacterium]